MPVTDPRPPIPDPQVVAIVGPTGVGKTALALELAQHLDAEIVNADSRQVYRGLNIGSAKPTADERALVPHHLFDVAEPDEPFDCARYRELARAVIAAIQARGKRALLVGGTGLYLKALRYGLFPGPPRDAALRDQLVALEAASPGSLYARLRAVDPIAADRLHPHDRVRLIRAIEVYERTGRPLSAWQEEHAFRTAELSIHMIGVTMARPALYERIDTRCRAMVEAGLVDEVRWLWQRGYGPDLGPLRSIGYREIGAHLQGLCDLDQAIADMARATRHLAKRQLTWFRADSAIHWFDAANAQVEILLNALAQRAS